MVVFSLNVLPRAVLGGGEDGVADIGGLERVAEGGVAWLAALEAGKEVGHLMYEGVLVADAQAGNPPLVHVRHVAVGDVHVAPAASGRLVTVVKILEAVEVVQIPANGGVGSVDFKRV